MARGQTLWLVGMMGAGKSTVGRALARRLGRRFVDSDAEIERTAGRSVRDIFEAWGEQGFRERERQVVVSLLDSGAVVALGGGAIAQPEIRRRVRGAGPIVYLRASPETLLERLGDCRTRPLLAGLDAEERRRRLAGLLAEREPAYREATLVLDTDGVEAGVLAERIASQLETLGRPCS